MNILMLTYSYYPYNYGGTEVYISGLAKYFIDMGHTVTIVAGMPPIAFLDHPVMYEDEDLKTLQYSHNNINIIGVVLKNETTQEIYTKYRRSWVNSWNRVLNMYYSTQLDILHTHAHTSAMGESLMEAAKVLSPALKIVASYHVPFSCVKGTLQYGNKMQSCTVQPATNICTACFLSDSQNWPISIVKIISGALLTLKNERLPTAFRLKYLVGEFIKSFKSFDSKVDQWHVFSEQIKKILLLNKIRETKITLIRHGVNPAFFFQASESIIVRQNANKIIYLYAGRFNKLKGFFTLLKAWNYVPQDLKKELWIIGENQTNDEEFTDQKNLISHRKDIKWLGSKTQEDLAVVMQEVHCTIIPSEWVEIGPLIFHEAISSGSDVIASAMGGCLELAEIYKDKSVVFKAGEATELSKKIMEFKYSGKLLPVSTSLQNYEKVYQSYLQLNSLE